MTVDSTATIEHSQQVNPPLVHEPIDSDIPPEYVYGRGVEPNPELLRKNNHLKLAQDWIAQFNAQLDAIATGDADLTKVLLPHAAWKDHLSISWDFHQYHRAGKIQEALIEQRSKFNIKNIAINVNVDPTIDSGVKLTTVHESNPPIEWLEVFVTFENNFGHGSGIIRLVSITEDSELKLKAFTLYTVLENITGNEEQKGRLRPEGVNHGQHKDRSSWLERRQNDFVWGEDKQPTVLIVGGGQGGLNMAARLKVMGISSLIVEKNPKIGDNWRSRYKFLVLHDPVWYDHLAYLNFPETWPVFTPKDKLGDWFEQYADSLELSYWVNKTVAGAEFNEKENRWTVDVVDNDSSKLVKLNPTHVIMATGHSGEPNVPHFKDEGKFKGTIVHSSKHTTGKMFKGENAIVIGCCNSGHDIAQDFYEQGAKTHIIQRSTTCVINSEIGLQEITKGLYDETGPRVDVADLVLHSMPFNLMNMVMQQQHRNIVELEKELHSSLKPLGFKRDSGYGGTGLFGKYFRRGGGYYIDVGCSKLLAEEKIALKQGVEVERFTEDGVIFSDGSIIDNLSIVVLATGYSNMRDTARAIFGNSVADKLNPVWGLDEEGETKTMWRDSGHPNFWYMGGNLALSRYYSKRLALKIIAQERGMI